MSSKFGLLFLNLVKFLPFDRRDSDRNRKIYILQLGYAVGIGRISARMPILPSSFHCGAFCFNSYGWNKKVQNLLSWKFKLSLENESFLAYCIIWPMRLIFWQAKVMAVPVHCVSKFVSCNLKPKQQWTKKIVNKTRYRDIIKSQLRLLKTCIKKIFCQRHYI